MSDDYFYGITLSASHQSETWDPETKTGVIKSSSNSKLHIRHALLGPDAKPDELNVIQVETMSLHEAIKMPVAVLKVGESRHVSLDIDFPDAPVTFTLIQGSGPVHLVGQFLMGTLEGYEDMEDMEEMEEEMLDEEEGDDSQIKDDENKRKAPAGKRKQNEEDDEEESEPKGKKAKMSNNAKGKAASPKKNAKK